MTPSPSVPIPRVALRDKVRPRCPHPVPPTVGGLWGGPYRGRGISVKLLVLPFLCLLLVLDLLLLLVQLSHLQDRERRW